MNRRRRAVDSPYTAIAALHEPALTRSPCPAADPPIRFVLETPEDIRNAPLADPGDPRRHDRGRQR
jgi:hypothetical protein